MHKDIIAKYENKVALQFVHGEHSLHNMTQN